MYNSPIHTTPHQYTLDEMMRVEKSALSLESRMKEYFKSNPGVKLSAEDLHRVFGGLLTSVRRSLTNLTNSGFLTKDTEHKKPGSNGVKIVTYYLKGK